MRWSFHSRAQAAAGLVIADGRLWIAHATRGKNGVEVAQRAAGSLALDPLVAEPEAVGRDLRAQFDGAKIGDRHVVVAIPATWVMSVHTRLPAGLPAADASSLLRLEAEKALPCDPDEVQIAVSRQKTAGAEYATQLAVRRDHLAKLSAALRAAGLKTLSYTLGFDALAGAIPPAGRGGITLALEGTTATLLVAAGGGIAALRTFDVPVDAGAVAVVREIRITFEQVPADLRREVGALRIRGDESRAGAVAEAAADWAAQAGLTLERVATAPVGADVADAIVLRLLGAATSTGAGDLELLAARPSRWTVLMARYNSPRLATAGFSAAAIAVIALLAFGWHEYRHWSLARQWAAMSTGVKDLTAINDRVREYRPWYDTSYHNLTVLRHIVECFPEDGSVSAKSVEIHGAGAITITGSTSDNGALLRTEDQLRRTPGVQNLHTEQIRGKTPSQFSVTFRWVAPSGP